MPKIIYPIAEFKKLDTPFYYYDLDLLRQTIREIKQHLAKRPFVLHYAMKANVNPNILKEILAAGFGADCVSGGEIQAALSAGITADKIVFAGVGKTDREIKLGLDNDIFCFNVESLPELEVINELAAQKNKIAQIALRINPNVNAHTHHYITTGLSENKFGINMDDLEPIIAFLPKCKNLNLIGLHFHIGSQITDMTVFQGLCVRVNEIQDYFNKQRIFLQHINVGGGLGVEYEHPKRFPIPNFEAYFRIFHKHLKLREGQKLHFELGRSVVAQCGSLIACVLYVKKGSTKEFVILDAGFTDLIRPALYQAHHSIKNLNSEASKQLYDIVGPICESSDVFAKAFSLNETHRGDLIALKSAGAYGEIMASQYNLRKIPKAYTSDELKGEGGK